MGPVHLFGLPLGASVMLHRIEARDQSRQKLGKIRRHTFSSLSTHLQPYCIPIETLLLRVCK